MSTCCDPDEIVEATIKYDGSLGIAFLWNGEVMVTTRRRMDSQQAIWAKQWIGDHCNLSEFQAGYTYLFEIVYSNNTMVVNYPFEGLVLLAITDEIGREMAYEELLGCAKTINFFMVTPRIVGPYSEVMWYCGGIKVDQKVITPFSSGASPVNEKRQEGWVVKFQGGNRLKIIHEWWKNASKLGQLVHPQVVWLLIKHDKIKDVFGDAPIQFKTEVRRMVRAVGRTIDRTLRGEEKLVTKERYEDVGFQEAETRRDVLNRTPFFHPAKANYRRVPILMNYVRPITPALKDYEPSENFKQTWCKGWKQPLTIEDCLFAQTVLQGGKSLPPFLRLPVEIILIILKLLNNESLTALAKVCVHLRHTIKSFKDELFKKNRRKKRRVLPSNYTRMSHSYCHPYSSDSDGYGSY